MNKKLVKFCFLLLAMSLLLAGCDSNNNQAAVDASKAATMETKLNELQNKLDQMSQEKEASKSVDASVSIQTQVVTQTVTQEKEAAPKVTSFIKITSPKNDAEFYEDSITVKGTVSKDAVSITAVTKGQEDVEGSNKIVLKNDAIPVDFTPGSSSFSYDINALAGVSEGTNIVTFTAKFKDGSTKTASVKFFYIEGGAEMGKPVIYLYPTKDSNVFVNVKPNNGISVSEPAINSGWNVFAKTTGELTNLADGKVYPYLFWEGYAANFVTPKEGFVVAKADVAKFFDAKLSYLGMNAKETADFKEFWVPRLAEKPYYFITFIDQNSIDKYAPLTVQPTPDSVIRVFFDYKGLDSNVSVPEQKLVKAERHGFSVVEWGGRLYR